MSVAGLAVYGLNVLGLAPGAAPVATGGEAWTVVRTPGPAPEEAGLSIWADRAWAAWPGTAELHVDRGARTATFVSPEPLDDAALLHPGLGTAAAVIAHWAGRVVLHAGAVVVDGHAWGILAERGGGKSTTVALLVEAGAELLADDVLVVADGVAFNGPASIDLREDAAGVLGATPLGRVGDRDRWRRATPVAAPTRLAGWIELAWGEPALEPRPLSAAIGVLGEQCVLPLADPAALFELAALGVLRLCRPRDLAAGGRAAPALLRELAGRG